MGNMDIIRLLCFLFFCHGALGINFPGFRVPLSRPRTSIYSLESCTDTSSSGATSVTPVVLAAGDGRQFTTPGKCDVGCKADPAGSYIPAAPRRGTTSTSRGFNHSLRGQTVGQLAAIIRAADQRTRGPPN